MPRHQTSARVRSFERSSTHFRTLSVLWLGLAACSSSNGADLFGAAGGAAATTAGAAGSPGGPQGLGGYGFVDDLDAVGGSAGTSSTSAPGDDAGALDPYVLPPSITIGDAGVVTCGTAACACSNGIDDDGDGKIDGFDEECTGAIDDDEGTFSTGIPGDNSDPKWQDCFFDGNSGAGDDHCRYHADCLTGDRPASDPDCAVSTECHDFCQARTPNGCDCFGCCTVQLDDTSSVSVFIGEACSLENIADEVSCPRCQPSAACGNTCGECELCPGKDVDDLPESCTGTPGDGSGGNGGSGGGTEPTPAYTCDGGRAVCSATSVCPGGQYCSLGCCLDVVIY